MRPISILTNQIEAQRGTLVYWAPIMLAIGIGIYFGLLDEPNMTTLGVLGVFGAVCGIGAFVFHKSYLVLPGLIVAGFLIADGQTHRVEAPVLSKPYFGTVEGRVIKLDRSASNNRRITLDQVYLRYIPAQRTPKRVRVSLSGHVAEGALKPGVRVMVRARLGPPGAPVEPGGFDFRRHAWFQQVGAVGYSRDPLVMSNAKPGRNTQIYLFSLRMRLANWIRARMEPQSGAFAAAIITGDRSEIPPDQMAALRASNLAHLLAISGLHMGLLTGFVFGVLRYGLALFPGFSMRIPVKKVAAIVALIAGAFYLAISGASVATQRAFIMAAVALIAVTLDRPVLSLRAVAIAAFAVLVISPNSLTGPGFQMSFAATTALVAAFGLLRKQNWWQAFGQGRWRYIRPVLMVAFTSMVAGAATAPYSAFHFNGVSQFGFVANVLAVPMMGLVVMPAAVLALILSPFGLAEACLSLMSFGINHILWVANWVSGMEGAIWHVQTGPTYTLALITVGFLLLVLIRGPVRFSGVVPVALALFLWSVHERPLLLVAENGRTFGLQTSKGRVLSSGRGNGFTTSIWLENDGDNVDMKTAFQRESLVHKKGLVSGAISKDMAVIWSNAKEPQKGLCAKNVFLIAPKWEHAPKGACEFIGQKELRKGGAHAVYVNSKQEYLLKSVRDTAGNRPWTSKAYRN